MSAVTQRFPIAVLAMAIMTLIWIIVPDSSLRHAIGRMLAGLVIGGFLCVIITLVSEVINRSKLYLVQFIIVAVLGVIFYFSQSLRLNILMAVGAVLLALGNAVGWKQPRTDLRIWDFTHKIWTGGVLAVVGSIIFMLGLLAIMFALKTLLGIDIESLVAELLMPIGFGFLAPVYWLSTVPPVDEPYEELYDNPGFVSKAIGFLGTWLLAPLTLIYGAIILTYGLKILMAWDLPKGEVAALTTPFLIVGALTWLVLEPPFIQKNSLARWFRWLWFPVSLPAAALLGIAIYIRIDQYGYTEQRVALVLAVIWALGIGTWFTIKKESARDIRLVPGVGAALLLIGSFTAQPLSVLNQTQRAKGLMHALELVDDSGTLTAIKNPTWEQTEQLLNLKNKLEYLHRKKAYIFLGKLFPRVDDVKKVTNIYEVLHIEHLSTPRSGNVPSVSFNEISNAFSIDGFQHISGAFTRYEYSNKRKLSREGDFIQLVSKGNDLTIIHPDDHVARINIEAALVELGPSFTSPLFVDVDARTRIQVKSLDMRADTGTEELKLTRLTFYVLTRD